MFHFKTQNINQIELWVSKIFQAFIVEGSDVGENRIKVRFYSNDDGELILNPKGLIKKLSYESFDIREDGVEDYFDDDNRNTGFTFPTFFFIKTGGSDIFSLGRLISFPEISTSRSW